MIVLIKFNHCLHCICTVLANTVHVYCIANDATQFNHFCLFCLRSYINLNSPKTNLKRVYLTVSFCMIKSAYKLFE